MALYLDTHGGPVVVTLTGNETRSRASGERYVEVAGWLNEPMYVSEGRLVDAATAEDATMLFGRNTMAKYR